MAETRATIGKLIEALRLASDLRQAAVLLRQSARAAGLTHVAVVTDASRPGALTDEHGESLVELLGWPEAFIESWLLKNYSSRSPEMVRARFEHLPFTWSTPSAEGGGRIAALRSLGITGSIMVPVRLPRGRFAVVAWLGPLDGPSISRLLTQLEPELLLLAHYFLELVRERLEPPPAAEDWARLSPRELQCLTGVAKGAGDGEVAGTLGLTPRTVRFHLQNAAAKLGARSRSHAVALATQLGILGSVF